MLEDNFPQGRPALEKVGAQFVADVSRHELMKLRILNGGHAAIAYPSALLDTISSTTPWKTRRSRAGSKTLEQAEIIPTLQPIPGISYDDYLTLIVSRFSNPEIGDTIPRLCLDGSNRQPKFILPTLRDRLAAGAPIDGLALELAFWCRYCEGTAEDGTPIPPNDDNAETLRERALAARDNPAAFLQNRAVFGDLGGDPRLNEAFATQLTRLRDRGVREALSAYEPRPRHNPAAPFGPATVRPRPKPRPRSQTTGGRSGLCRRSGPSAAAGPRRRIGRARPPGHRTAPCCGPDRCG